jgi:hypothetical protein
MSAAIDQNIPHISSKAEPTTFTIVISHLITHIIILKAVCSSHHFFVDSTIDSVIETISGARDCHICIAAS